MLDKRGNENQDVENKWPDSMMFVGRPRHCGVVLWGWTGKVDLMNHLCGQAWGLSQNKNVKDPFTAIQRTVKKSFYFPCGFHVKKEYFFSVCVHSLWFEPSTEHIQPVHWFHIIWSLGAFQFMCKLRGMRYTVLTWRSGNHIKDSERPCLRIVWNHEPNRDVSENMSYLLELCIHKGFELPVVQLIPAMLDKSDIICCCHLLQLSVTLCSLGSPPGAVFLIKMCIFFFPPVLVNFV